MRSLPLFLSVATLGTTFGCSSPSSEVVDGLQLRLEAPKLVFAADEIPHLTADALVLEDGKLGFIDPPLGTLLEVDGVSYHIPAAGALSTGGPPVRGDIYGLSLILNPEAFQNQDGESFSLAPGKHRIRMAMFAQPVSNSQAEPQWVYSNLVEVVILDP